MLVVKQMQNTNVREGQTATSLLVDFQLSSFNHLETCKHAFVGPLEAAGCECTIVLYLFKFKLGS